MLTRKIEQLDYNEGGTIAINNDMQEEYPIDVRIRRIPEKRILVYNPKNFDVSPILDWLKSKGIQYVHGQNQMFNIGDVFCCEIPKDFINDDPMKKGSLEEDCTQ